MPLLSQQTVRRGMKTLSYAHKTWGKCIQLACVFSSVTDLRSLAPQYFESLKTWKPETENRAQEKISFHHTGIIFLSQVLEPGLSLSLIDNWRAPPLNPLTFVRSLPGRLLFHCSTSFTYGWPGAPGLSFPTGIQPWTLLLFYSSDLRYTKF